MPSLSSGNQIFQDVNQASNKCTEKTSARRGPFYPSHFSTCTRDRPLLPSPRPKAPETSRNQDRQPTGMSRNGVVPCVTCSGMSGSISARQGVVAGVARPGRQPYTRTSNAGRACETKYGRLRLPSQRSRFSFRRGGRGDCAQPGWPRRLRQTFSILRRTIQRKQTRFRYNFDCFSSKRHRLPK